ncbi:ABC transporter ATP-binding protein [Jiangella alkaliphila]|nr:ATP-binding cassette domain-containing protein [Jiangella alkaliphila]
MSQSSAVEAATSAPTGPPALEVRGVTVRYGGSDRPWRHAAGVLALDDVSLTVPRHASLGIVGTTGSGKSTLAKAVMGMVRPTAGTVLVDGRDVHARAAADAALVRRRQLVLQDPHSSLDPRMRIGDIIAEPLRAGARVSRDRRRERVAELLELVGLPPGKASMYPHQFSGGQLQRVAVARALAPEPSLIVLDEPTSALDVSVRAQVLNLLRRLQDAVRVSYVVISHDLLTASYLAERIAVFHEGRVVEIGTPEEVYTAPVHPYTAELLACVPTADGRFVQAPRPGPPVHAIPAAPFVCAFAPDCPDHPSTAPSDDPGGLRLRPSGRQVACFAAGGPE